MTYLIIKALHLTAVVSWFAGLFYIFRLFVYHVQHWQNAEMRDVFSTMERKLLRFIMLPASVASLGLGLAMLTLKPALLQTGWFWVKLLFVLALFAYHGLAAWTYRQMHNGRLVFSEKSCRLINEVPTLALVVISLLVFLKPF